MTEALIVIDAQESFRQRDNWQAVSNPDIVARIDQLVTRARSRGDLVVWVLHTEPHTGTVFDPALGFVRPLEGLAPLEDEPVLRKTVHNAFTTTNLAHLLTSAGILDLTVCGVRTEQCCETTARLASDLGYRVTFAIDATATTPIEHPDAPACRGIEEILADPTTLSTQDIVARTVYALSGRFADVRTVAEVLAGDA
ncbi:isochorismatase family protein [Actinoalloteichus hymeniacidonis]|uniref:Nicotinamidase-like amidase n=1 Tax=Actinoalloteichus hymeniacidonis TaxID=340345 RepID=A0AAC9HPL5_9PSEU|nr:isochorismatase family protein [Actinoalloteichus hymeniacidonis]AOS63054.1 nicotinamidase-like amidase [Actinoalloteichus hymeniacidonis]MBB5908911.1 nicotinamidase-related amidase [Actinoalloteichus hymeniacidonis]